MSAPDDDDDLAAALDMGSVVSILELDIDTQPPVPMPAPKPVLPARTTARRGSAAARTSGMITIPPLDTSAPPRSSRGPRTTGRMTVIPPVAAPGDITRQSAVITIPPLPSTKEAEPAERRRKVRKTIAGPNIPKPPPNDTTPMGIPTVTAQMPIPTVKPAKPAPPPPPEPAPPPPPAPKTKPPSPPPGRRSAPSVTRAPISAATQLATGRPESPTVVERALAVAADADRGRSERLKKELERTASSDPRHAAMLAYELGELNERKFGDDELARSLFARALMLDPSLRPAQWALRRMLYQAEQWPALIQLLEQELAYTTDGERADVLLELAHIYGRVSRIDDARGALDKALAIAPEHEGALVALQRLLARGSDRAALLDVTSLLAEITPAVERRIAYRLAVARDPARPAAAALRDCEEAAALVDELPGSDARLVERLARTRAELAEAAALSDADLPVALGALVSSMTLETSTSGTGSTSPGRMQRELIALQRRRAQLVRSSSAQQAWELLKAALELAPDDPALLAELIELSGEVGRYQDLIALVRTWRTVETDIGRTRMVSAWCAAALGGQDKRFWLRPVLAAASAGTPGYLLVTAATEGSVFADPENIAVELSTTYVGAARAAADGSWAGPGTAAVADPAAAVALYIQAADLLAYQLATPSALEQARDALARAAELAPGHPVVVEAGIELDDLHGTADQLRGRLRALASERASLDDLARATRIAASHDLTDVVIDLERRALASVPASDPAYWALAYRLEAGLRRLGRVADRSALLTELARGDGDPQRRLAALFDAARTAQAAGDTETAAELFLELAARDTTNRHARAAYLDLLRSDEKWAELVAVRRAEIEGESDPAALRRAFREAAWVLEVRVGDPAAAADIYDQWLVRTPDDRTALEGVARCRGALRDPQRESVARASIARIDDTPDARWLHARSVERAGRYAEASELYREILAAEDPSVAVANAAVALGDLAAASTDIDARIAAARALAKHTSHPELGASLHELCGWFALIMLGDAARATEEFAAAVERDPARRGALLGAYLAGGQADITELAATTPVTSIGASLRLRAAANALATQNRAATRIHIDAALALAPDDPGVLCAAAEAVLPDPEDATDPFGAAERYTARAAVYDRRAALAEDAPTRRWWTLQRAEMLELAEENEAAAAVLAAHLDVYPADRRALAAVKRIATRAGDIVREAESAYVLAQATHAPETKLQLLRAAAAVYDRPGPTNHVGYAVTIYRQIVEVDPAAPESDRLLSLLREASNSAPLIDALGEQIAWLAKATPRDSRVLSLLLERSVLLRDRGRLDLARGDLDALLAHSPHHAEALRIRADIAAEEGDHEAAITLCQRFLALENTGSRRIEIEKLLAREMQRTAEPTQTSRAFATPDYEEESVTVDADLPDMADPFGGATAVADLSKLQEQEKQVARTSGQFTSVGTSAETPSKVRAFERQTTQSEDRELLVPAVERMQAAIVLEPSLDARRIQPAEREAPTDISALVLMPVRELQQARTDAWNQLLADTERELAVTPEGDARLELLVDAGYLAATVGDTERARRHYGVAGALRPALEGLRMLALRRGDLAEAVRLLEAELPLASRREHLGLAHYRLDLLVAGGNHDVARRALDELLAGHPDDAALWLVAAEVALRDRRTPALATALERLAEIEDPQLRAAATTARAVIAVQSADSGAAATWFASAADGDAPASAARIEAIRYQAASGSGDDAGAALLDVALHVDRDDPVTAAGLALRAQSWITSRDSERGRETIAEAAQLAARAAPKDALVARTVAESALANEEANVASHAFVRWTRCKSSRAERAYAAARAAELEPARFGRLWSQVLDLDPGDDYATSRLRAAHIASGALDQALELDLAIARDSGNDAPVVRAARALVDDGDVERAVTLLGERPPSWQIREALADAHAMNADWEDSAHVLDALLQEPGPLAAESIAWRRAHAWTTAWRNAAPEDEDRLARAALDAWGRVLEIDRRAPVAHATSIRLATELGDIAILGKVIARARANEASPWAAASLALRHARAVFATDPKLAGNIARAAAAQIDDPRCTMTALLAAAKRNELATAASVLEERATRLETESGSNAGYEPVMLRTRAAWLALEANDVSRAQALLAAADAKVPDLVSDLIAVATQRSGGVAPKPAGAQLSRTCFARLVHDADRAAATGSRALALELYTRALALRPGDPIAARPVIRLARQLGNHAALGALARDQLRAAEGAGDVFGQADARELLATVAVIRGEHAAARTELATALRLDPARWDLLATLEIETAASAGERELLDVRDQLLARPEAVSAGLALDTAAIAMRRPATAADLLGRWYTVLDRAPAQREALFHVESHLRGSGASEELAQIEERIADTFEDPRGKAAFLTRAGETLVDLGRHATAVDCFARAHEAAPDYTAALDAWRNAALAGEEWIEVARATLLDALREHDPERRASLEHFAAVALMDKSGQRELAIDSLTRALEAQPNHVDSLLRLRLLVQSPDEQQRYGAALARRADAETDPAARVELMRLLAEHQRDLGNIDEAVRWYRAMLSIEPADVRAHAAIAECSTDPRDRKRLADALQARVPLERDVHVLRGLVYRIGQLHLDDDPAAALAAFKQALTYRPDDGESLRRVIELATRQRDWQTAASTSERLIGVETQPARRADALLRAARIQLHGFSDRARAHELVSEALETDPTNTALLELIDELRLDGMRTQIVAAMRERLAESIMNGPAARMLSRATRSRRVARMAAELAEILGAAEDAERALIAQPPGADPAVLLATTSSGALFADAHEPALRHLFRVMAEPIARVLGTDLAKHGVGRKDRLPSSNPVAMIVRSVATSLGLKEPDVYVSASHGYAIIAEPTRPISLVFGNAIAADESCVRFATGAALELARLSLAIPARLPPNELAVLAGALVSLTRPNGAEGMPPAVVSAMQALRKHATAAMIDEARQTAAAIVEINAASLARDLKLAGLRAGMIVSGSLRTALTLLAGAVRAQPIALLEDASIRQLVQFALADHPELPGW